jgi:hypothetical protein
VVILVDRNWISGTCQWCNVGEKNQSSYLTVGYNDYKATYVLFPMQMQTLDAIQEVRRAEGHCCQ